LALVDDDELVPDEALNPDDAPVDSAPQDAAPEDEDPKYTALKSQIEELKSRPAGNPELGELVALGKQFLAGQAPQDKGAAPDPAALKAFGERLQQLAVTGDPSEFATALLTAVNDVSARNVDAAAQRFGTPLVEKAGQFAVQAFLSHKRDVVGDNGSKLHTAISKDFKLTQQERNYIATANADEADSFLERKYKETAGDILLKSSGRARPRNLSGGDSGGKTGGGSAIPTPLQELAEQYWPDPKVRAEKLKAIEAGGEV